MTRVAGLPQTASQRALDLFLKVSHLQRVQGGVVFATGTPVANSVAEMFTMQRYLQMTALKGMQIDHFDAWAGTFGEPVTAMELAPDGSGYRLNTRFARYAARGITGVMPTPGLCRIGSRSSCLCCANTFQNAA
jgi:N12 class adenine-specific DNA methylase